MKKTWLSYQNMCLGVYHLIFVVVAYFYTLKHQGDANLYWFLRPVENHAWLDFLNVGTDFILFLNYPFAKLLELPFFVGFLLYGFLGFIGILQFQQLTYHLLGTSQILVKQFNILPLLFFLPNLHFWTANLGKETLCFLWLSTIFLKLAKKEYSSWGLWISVFFLFMLRPHVFLMLLVPVVLGVLFSSQVKIVYKWGIGVFGAIGVGVAYYFFLLLSEIKSFDWERLQRFNLGSILSFQKSGSYVPIHEYSYPEKFFAFFFRPFFFDAKGLYQWVLSVENLFLLSFHLVVLYFVIISFKSIRLAWLEKVLVGFVLFSFLLYVERYAGLGIFVRTKVMLQPFLLIVLIKILLQVKSNAPYVQT